MSLISPVLKLQPLSPDRKRHVAAGSVLTLALHGLLVLGWEGRVRDQGWGGS